MQRFLTYSALSVMLITTAYAALPEAQLSDISGPVLVDKGAGFVRISVPTELSAGSRILVSKGGKATLAYAEGCTLALTANTVTTVAAAGGCKVGEQVAGQAVGDRQQINGVWYVVAAGVGGVGVGWLIADATQSDDSHPVYIPIPISP